MSQGTDEQGQQSAETGTPQRRPQRLTPLDRAPELLPWRRAQELTRCHLYWAPVTTFPIPTGQRRWLISFFDLLTDLLASQFGLRPELFLQIKVIYPAFMKKFLTMAPQWSPLMGLSRRPRAPLPNPPNEQDIQAIIEGRKQYNLGDYVGDYCYWFVDKSHKEQRDLFFGAGGMSTIFLESDPKTKAPPLPFSPAVRKEPIFQKLDVDRIHARTFALMDGFQEKSKTLFGSGLEDEPQFRGIPFIIPLLGTAEFFNEAEEETKKWFELFGVYINESPADKGIVLASKFDFEERLIELLERMRADGQIYPEG